MQEKNKKLWKTQILFAGRINVVNLQDNRHETNEKSQ